MTTSKEIINRFYSANGNCEKLLEIFNNVNEDGFEAEIVEYDYDFQLNLWEGDKLVWETKITKTH